MGRISLSIYMKGDYEEMWRFGLGKNKANSKPNSYVSMIFVPFRSCFGMCFLKMI